MAGVGLSCVPEALTFSANNLTKCYAATTTLCNTSGVPLAFSVSPHLDGNFCVDPPSGLLKENETVTLNVTMPPSQLLAASRGNATHDSQCRDQPPSFNFDCIKLFEGQGLHIHVRQCAASVPVVDPSSPSESLPASKSAEASAQQLFLPFSFVQIIAALDAMREEAEHPTPAAPARRDLALETLAQDCSIHERELNDAPVVRHQTSTGKCMVCLEELPRDLLHFSSCKAKKPALLSAAAPETGSAATPRTVCQLCYPCLFDGLYLQFMDNLLPHCVICNNTPIHQSAFVDILAMQEEKFSSCLGNVPHKNNELCTCGALPPSMFENFAAQNPESIKTHKKDCSFAVIKRMRDQADDLLMRSVLAGSDTFVACPGAECTSWVEVAVIPHPATGKPMKIRQCAQCLECSTTFCPKCGSSPYHFNTECEIIASLREDYSEWMTRGRQQFLSQRAELDAIFQKQLQEYEADKMRVEAETRQLEAVARAAAADEAYKAQNCKLCPNPECRRIVVKLEGCDLMKCGEDWHGGNKQNGCGLGFKWSQAPAYQAQDVKPRQIQFNRERPQDIMYTWQLFEGQDLLCDACAQPIVGPKFTCINCQSLTICVACESLGPQALQVRLKLKPQFYGSHKTGHLFMMEMPPQADKTSVEEGNMQPEASPSPLQVSQPSGTSAPCTSPAFSFAVIAELMESGFDEESVKAALLSATGDAKGAMVLLMSPRVFLRELLEALDYCSSDTQHDEARRVVKVELCPAEMNNEEEVTAEFTYCRLFSALVITNITVGGGRNEQRVAEYAKKVEKRIRLPFFIESSDHVKHFIRLSVCTEGLRSCPLPCGCVLCTPFRGIASSLTSSPRYAKYLDWLHSPPNWFHSPPNFAAIRLNDSDQRSNPMSLIKLYSEARQANSSCDMRMYLDDRDEHRAILKFSPHIFFDIFAEGAHVVQGRRVKSLCDSIGSLSGCLGINFHVWFPPNYPERAPVMRLLATSDDIGHLLAPGSIVLDALWQAGASFVDTFRNAFCIAMMDP